MPTLYKLVYKNDSGEDDDCLIEEWEIHRDGECIATTTHRAAAVMVIRSCICYEAANEALEQTDYEED